MAILGNIAGVGGFICWIMTLIKIFQDKEKNGVLHGILGIVTCGLWAFIWGWMNSKRYGNKNVMIAWTVCWIASVAFSGAQISQMLSGAGGG